MEEGEGFENLVAAALLKRLQFLEDREGCRYELRYLRDKEGRELDFVILKENRIDELVEVKWAEETVFKSLLYYAERLQPRQATPIVARLKRPYDQGKMQVRDPFAYFTPEVYAGSA